MVSGSLDALHGDFAVIATSLATSVGALSYGVYRYLRLRVVERMHARELGALERMHARELEAVQKTVERGATATFGLSGTVVPSPMTITAPAQEPELHPIATAAALSPVPPPPPT